jgi:hypothetical protein
LHPWQGDLHAQRQDGNEEDNDVDGREEEEEDDDGVDTVTEEAVQFADNVARHPETWLNFPTDCFLEGAPS